MGFEIILAYNNFDLEMIFNLFSIIYSDMIIYKDLYLQWLVDKINSFLNKDITISDNNTESNVEAGNNKDNPLDSSSR